jgi:hypothetical protein
VKLPKAVVNTGGYRPHPSIGKNAIHPEGQFEAGEYVGKVPMVQQNHHPLGKAMSDRPRSEGPSIHGASVKPRMPRGY